MDALKAALDRNAPADELDKATDKLMDEWQKVGAKMYQQAGPQTPPPGENPFGGGPAGRPVRRWRRGCGGWGVSVGVMT